MKYLYQLFLMAAILLLPSVMQAQDDYVNCTFEDDSDTTGWVLLNGSQANQWVIDSAVARTGSKSLYISSSGHTHTYNTSSTSVTYAYRELDLAAGAYAVSYDWIGYGESSYDYLRVFLVPSSANISAGVLPDGTSSSYSFTNPPAGWIALDGGNRLNNSSSWQTFTAELYVSVADTYKLAFMWANDGSAGSNPPAAVDNIIFMAATCPTPVFSGITNLSTTSFDYSFIDASNGDAYYWVAEIDSANQPRGMGYVINIYDTVISFTGLTPNTDYTVHINAICNSGDTSFTLTSHVHTPCSYLVGLPWSESFETTLSGGSTSRNFVECMYRLNDGTTYFGYPYVSNSTTYSHTGTHGLYWYNSSSAGTYGSYQCVVLPGIDTNIVHLDSAMVAFWAKASSTSYRPVFEVGMMSNPNDISTFVPIHTVNVSGTDWNRYEVSLSHRPDSCNFVAVKASAATGSWYAYVDDFSIEVAPLCRYVYSVDVDHVLGASAYCTWSLQGTAVTDPSLYVVSLRNDDDPTAARFTDTTSSLAYFFSGLAPSTHYTAFVSSLCGNDTIFGDSASFITRCLVGGATAPTGTDLTQTSNVPVNSGWGNTFCQSIYTAAELTALGLTAGPIQGVTYTWTTSSSYNKELTLFMGLTTTNTFSSTTPLTGSMTQVYNGTHSIGTSGTVEYYFTTPFIWDGTSNIVLSSFVNQPSGESHSSSGFYGYSTNCGSTRTQYAYRDATAWTTSNLTAGSHGTSTYRPNVSFIKPCDTTATCAAPNVIVTDVQAYEASLIWAPGNLENTWNIDIRTASESAWTREATGVIATRHTFTGLQPMEDYVVRIVPNCGADSVYAMAQFTTPCVPLTTLPFNENFENFIASSTTGSPITPCWHRGTSYTYNSYPYVNTSYAHSGSHSIYFYNSGTSYYTYLALPAMAASIDSLQVSFATYLTSAGYSVMVGVMSDPDNYSTFTPVTTVTPTATNTWEMHEVLLNSYEGEGQYIALAANQYTYMYIDDIEVSYSPDCPRPTNVTVGNITTSTATVHWTDTAANFFEIEYGPAGFARGTGTTLTSMLDSTTLYGLSHSSSYDVYVRGLCSAGDTSNWSFVTTFATQCGVIDSLPYIQNFAGWGVGSSARPACWGCGGYSSYPYIVNVTDGLGQTIGQTLYMYSYSTNRVYASLPELDSISYPVRTVQAVFQAWSANFGSTSYSHSLIVGVCSTQGDLTTFVPADTIALTGTPELYEVSFDTFYTGGKYITFVSTCTDPSAYYNYCYLDSVAIELIPDCQSPHHLTSVGVTSNSATIGWTPRTITNTWQVEYGPRGFVIGTGTRFTTGTNPHTITGLTPSTDFDFYVRNICGAGDTSNWNRTPGRFATMQNPATVPYFCDFENAAEWDNWQTTSNSTITWYRDTAAGDGTNGYGTTGAYAIYISADSGRTVSTNTTAVVNACAYRDIDFGTIDTGFVLSFRASAGGCRVGNSVYDGLAVFMVDPNTPFTDSDSPLESPWGSVNSISLLATVYGVYNWNTTTVILDSITGIHRLVFYWFNQNTTSIGTFYGIPATVDDVSIQYATCPRPYNIRATRVTMASADVTWHGNEDGDYRVTLRNSAGAMVSSTLVHTNSIHFNGLNSGQQYSVLVRHICSDNDSSMLPSGTFTTLICNEGLVDTFDVSGTNVTSQYLPVPTYYNYGYSQQIFRADELTGSGSISAISFNYAYASALSSKVACTLYLGHTSLSSFPNDSTFVDPATMQVVYTGPLTLTQGWNRIILNAPFDYDGRSNLVLAVDDNSGRYSGSSYTFYCDQTNGNTSLYFYSDGANPLPSSAATLNEFNGERQLSALRNQVIFEYCPPNSCPNPILRTPIVRTNSVTLRWRNTGTSYQVGYRLSTTSGWISDFINTDDTFYVLNNVYPNTDYVYHVRQFCDTTGISNWAVGTFNSGDIPCLSPMNLHMTDVTNKKVTLYWTPDENNLSYRLRVFNTYFDRTITCYLAHGSVNGLQAGMTYYATVQAICQGMDEPSEYSDTISFVTDVCPDVTNLTVSDIQGNSCVLDWTEGGRAEEWEIQYGLTGFAAGTGTTLIVDHHPYTLTGLMGQFDYDVYVRAKCGEGFMSENWSNRASFTTLYSNIRSVTDDARVRIYPNPASTDVEVTLPAANGQVRIEVIDAAGRTQQTYLLAAGTEKALLRASELAQGAYYIRIVGGDINTVKKLIVK